MVRYVKLNRRIALALWCAFGLSACSNFSAANLFSHYSVQKKLLYDHVSQGDYQQAQLLAQDDVAGDILDNMERGRISLLNQDIDASRKWFEVSDTAVTAMQNKAVISLSDSAASVGALAVNDNLTEYDPADYELGFLHLYLALTYIQGNQLDDALVEFRRADQVQEKAKQIREAALAKEANELNSKGVSANIGSVLAQYPNAQKSLGAIQNGYLFFLSGLVFEADGNLNDAYIDYKRALALQPDNPTVVDSVIRTATKLGANQDLKSLIDQYGRVNELTESQARLIVIQEQSVVDALQAWKQSLPIFSSKGQGIIYSMTLPYYPEHPSGNFEALSIDGESLQGSLLTDVNVMARYQLHERISSLLLRQVFRVIAKEQVRQQVSKDDPLSGLLVNVLNTLTEQPDTRSWLTLPEQVYSASHIVSVGEHNLMIGGKNYSFNTQPQNTTLVWISRQSGQSVVWHKQLGKL
jgi:hypothetical protein